MDFASAIVEADKRSRSWREKLEAVRELLARENAPLTLEALLDIAIYLRFLAAGEVACVEDGRHFRPHHHARIALQIRERLAGLSTPDTAYLARKIYPFLPSSAQTFQRAEPLTRIRDIAHRNDISPALKREIKTSLQNKLHRCAGPEDLVTSARLLEQITAPGSDYSPAFVEQFRIFHKELEEFFNARGLDERLAALLPAADKRLAALLNSFLSRKSTHAQPLPILDSLTELRCELAAGVRPAANDQTQELLLADVGLEDFAFVLLSEIINSLEASSRSDVGPQNPHAPDWPPLLTALRLCVVNMELSQISPAECRALQNELIAWQKSFDPADRHQLLRLKATVERTRRVAEDYTDRVLALYAHEAQALGRALGVAEPAIRVFCQGEIRGHLIFQLSKLASLALRRIRQSLGLPGWDVLVSGQTAGRVRCLDSLEDLGPALPEPTIVLLKTAAGDEDIPNNIAGIVLAHELPHLSHLGVRARQSRVVFVACEEPENLEPLRSLQNQIISLNATTRNVEWEIISGLKAEQNKITASTASRAGPPTLLPVKLEPGPLWFPLNQIRLKTGGGKADGARRLAGLAQRGDNGFATPPAVVIPFGIMEAAIHAAPALESRYKAALARMNTSAMEDLPALAKILSDLVDEAKLPGELVSALVKQFTMGDRLMVRSSSNGEDLPGLAGAGLYESVPNVSLADLEPAVRKVWASLWTRRAVIGRQLAGIRHEQAHMAVLIQQMLPSDYSFVLHTVNPLNENAREVYLELVVGLGETLVSGAARGTPYRVVCDKESGAASILAYANFSQALRCATAGGLARDLVDYSQVELSSNAQALCALLKRLSDIARFVESAFETPLDIEGAVVGNQIFLVQARPQQGLTGPKSDNPDPRSSRGNEAAAHERKQEQRPRHLASEGSPSEPPRRPSPLTLGLFEKRIDGDDSLLELARLRFQQAGMGAEMHAATPDQQQWNLRFRPSAASPVVVHLSRDLNLMDRQSRDRITEFAARFAGRVYGLVLHDHSDLAHRPKDFLRAAREMEGSLAVIQGSPLLFVEYAAGLEPAVFSGFFHSLQDTRCISACIDVGHVGIRQVRASYAASHSGEDVCALKTQRSKWPSLMGDIEKSVLAALPVVIDLIKNLGGLGKPVHFHLHDGHPLSTFSPFGVSDHLSFLGNIPLDFEYRGNRNLPLMYGPEGLARLVAAAGCWIGFARCSFSLEIHPAFRRLDLGDAARLFGHWRDKTNAEQMNHWLSVLSQNHALLLESIQAATDRGSVSG